MCIAQAIAAGEVLGSLAPAASWVGERVTKWQDQKDAEAQAASEARIARLQAERELAAWKAKSEVEWDLEWAKGAQSSWKDEWLLIMWSLPLVGLFIPGLRPFVADGFDYLRTFNPDAPQWYMAGWGILFSAVFGVKSAMSYMMPDRYAKLAGAMGALDPDIPISAASMAQSAINRSPTK